MSEIFSLKWNDFETNVSRTFGVLRKEKEFFDVTLVSDDNHQVQAHKLLLSACSPFFRNILTQNPHSHPLLCLDGIRSDDLQFVLDYIYHGEVQIGQEQLDRFLNIAQKLKLEGLTTTVEGNFTDGNESAPDQLDNSTTNAVVKKETTNTAAKKEETERKKRRKTTNHKNRIRTLIKAEDGDTGDFSEEINKHLIEKDDGTYSCGFCGKTGDAENKRKKFLMQRHLETHLNGAYPCPICQKLFRSKNSLNTHTSIFHRK